MDAVKLSFSKTAFLLSLALLIPSAATAQAAFSPALGTVTLVGQTPVADTISSTGSPITFNAMTAYAPGDPHWLTIDSQATTDALNGLVTPATLNIRVGQQAGLLVTGTHTATITLQAAAGDTSGAPNVMITVTYTTGSSGGNTAGLVSATPSAPSATAAFGTSTFLTFSLISSSATPISFTLQPPSSSTPWVTSFTTLSGQTSGSVYSGNPVTLEVGLNGATQPLTVLTATLVVTYANNSLTIPITFGNGTNGGGSGGTGSLQLSQSTISWSYSNGGNFPPQTGINVSSTSGAASFNTTTSPINSWFAVVPANGALPNLLTVEPTAGVASLATGVYNGTVTVAASDGSSQTITINLTVNGGSSNGLTVSPNPISLQTQVNGAIVQQSATVTSIVGGNLTASVSGTGLTVAVSNSSIFANTPTAAIVVSGNPSGLANGTYVGTLTVNVGGISQAVQVNFVVGSGTNGGGGTSSFTAAPSSLNFVYQNGSTMASSQQQQLYLSGTGNYTAAVTSNTGNWLSISSGSGTLPSQNFVVFANASGLASGTYTGAITFTNTSTNQTSVVNVTLLVTGTTAIYTSPGDLVFNFINGTSSATQILNLTLLASDNSPVQVSAAVSNPSNTPWLTIFGNGSTTAGLTAYSVAANANNLANGVYTGYITVSGATANSPLNVPVVLNVIGSTSGGGGTGTGGLTLGASSLTFQPAVNGVALTQQLSVSAASTTSFNATATVNNGNSTWLSISPSGASVTNSTLTVTANPAGLTAGTYNGQITFVSSAGTQTVPVTMIVGGNGSGGSGGNITVTANGGSATSPTLTFNAQAIGAAVTPQYLTVVSASGSAGIPFVASLTGTSCGWVQLGITAGQQYTTPLNPLNVGATTGTLASGTYNCSLILTPSGGTAVTIPLTLTVVGTPTISVATTALTFAYSAGTATPATQTIQVTATGSSAAAFTATATSTSGTWLSVTPTSGSASSTSPANLTVSVNPTSLAAGTYTGTISIVAGSGATGSASVPVTLTVTAPTPTITTVVNGASFLGGSLAPGEFVSIFGTSLGPLAPVSAVLDSTGKIATAIGNVQVFFGGTAAPMIYASSGQINCIVPYEVAGLASVQVQVKYLSQPSNTVTLGVAASAPGVFSSTGSGTGQGAIINQSLLPNTVSTPAPKGSIVQIYVTGEGLTTPAGVTGGITGNATTVPNLPIAVMIGGTPATVVFKGELPGNVAGVLQLNVMVPTASPSGSQPVSVVVGSVASQNGITIAVQ